MEHALVNFRAEWDDEAGVWYVAEASYPGLTTEAPTLDALVKRVREALHELREVNEEPEVVSELEMRLAA